MMFLESSALNISRIQILSDAFAAEDFHQHCGKRRNCSELAISPFAIIVSTHFNNNTFIDFFCLDVFKVVFLTFAVCGKGSTSGESYLIRKKTMNGFFRL